MDALMPLASLPTQIAGRNRAWRRVVIDAITERSGVEERRIHDAAAESAHGRGDAVSRGDNPSFASGRVPRWRRPIRRSTGTWRTHEDEGRERRAIRGRRLRDYDPGPKLGQIKAPLFAVNSSDDLINPRELGILEQEIKKVPKGRAIVIPMSERTVGHGTHTVAAMWKQYLEELLKMSAK